MGLIAAKCTECGANIEVDQTKKADVCPFCGCAYVTQDAIVNYNTTIINNNSITADNVNIVGGDFNNLFKLAKESWDCNDYDEAFKLFSKALEISPDHAEAILYRGLSKGWQSKGNACYLNVTDAAFKKVYLQNRSKLTEDQKSAELDFLGYYNSLVVAISDLAEEVYSPDCSDTGSAELLWSNVSNCISSQNTIIAIFEKDLLPSKYQLDSYIVYLKNLSSYYIQITSERYWNTYNTGGLLDIRKIYVFDRESYLTQLSQNDNKIQQYDSSYSPCEIEYGKTGCYIATAVYGSYDCPQVWTLRRYRDYTLGENWAGRLFIKVYYAISPTIVKIFGKTKWFNSFWKKVLDKKVQKLQLNGVESTPYVDKVWRKGQYRHHDENNDK